MTKQQLIFATGNAHKLVELRKALGDSYEIAGLKDLGIYVDIPEEGSTLEENAHFKAQYLYQRLQRPCLAEDTGLEVPALNRAPGVHSARFAGPDKDPDANNALLLESLRHQTDRTAQFRTIIALVDGIKTHFFEGICKGYIAREPRGSTGFGYDPLFIPQGEQRSFAQMTTEEKNKISHRGKAINKLVDYLNHLPFRRR